MTSKVNKYGRQVFLSREEISYLRGLVDRDIVSLNDQMREVEEAVDPAYMTEHTDVRFWQEQKVDIERDLKIAQKLSGDVKDEADKGKLWYYVSEEEMEARKR